MRSITCTNMETGASITIGEDSFSPLFLAGLEGVYSASNSVVISNNTMMDGGTYQGSTANIRNIVITALDIPNNHYNQTNRDIIYTIFRKGELGVLVYQEDNKSPRKIEYYVESVEREDGGKHLFTISLLCPDPAFSDIYDSEAYMASWIGQFEFIHEFDEDGEELGYRMLERLVEIVNDSAAKELGITAIIETVGNVTNPTLTHVESEEYITLGDENNPFHMVLGDVVTITTTKNNKHVRIKRAGSESETEVNEYLTEDSEFFQLLYGTNHIAYSAEYGEEYMTVTIKYAYKYDGA